MKNNNKESLRNVLAFLVGFVGFQIVWYLILLPLIK